MNSKPRSTAAAHTAHCSLLFCSTHLLCPQAVSAVFAAMTPEQFAHVNVGTTPAHPNAMCIAETLAVAAGEPHAREFVGQLQNQGKAVLCIKCRLRCSRTPCCALAAYSAPAALWLLGRMVDLDVRIRSGGMRQYWANMPDKRP
jgi:hypothetical protein